MCGATDPSKPEARGTTAHGPCHPYSTKIWVRFKANVNWIISNDSITIETWWNWAFKNSWTPIAYCKSWSWWIAWTPIALWLNCNWTMLELWLTFWKAVLAPFSLPPALLSLSSWHISLHWYFMGLIAPSLSAVIDGSPGWQKSKGVEDWGLGGHGVLDVT